MNKNYNDIINLPHHISRTHPQMPLINRAAQFAPFDALAGYMEAIGNTAEENILNIENEIELADVYEEFLSSLPKEGAEKETDLEDL